MASVAHLTYESATCADSSCRGRIFRRIWSDGQGPRSGWMHLRTEDWVDNIHQATPAAGTITAAES